MHELTVIDEGRVAQVPAAAGDGTVRLAAAALQTALGWELKPQGLCKADRCIPVSTRPGLVNDAGIDLLAFADLLSRPIAIDSEERAAYLGASAEERTAQLSSLQAPDFTLPDVDGTLHSLSDYRGKKVLLVAYASW